MPTGVDDVDGDDAPVGATEPGVTDRTAEPTRLERPMEVRTGEPDEGATKREGPAGTDRGTRRKGGDAHLTRGTLVGRYVVLEVLGEGGMGVVYSAYDPELDRKVAIKLLQARPGGSESGGEQSWLLREAQALARLAHPNVVGVHDVGTLPGDRVFVAMELVPGQTLRKWLEGATRSWREVLPVMIEAGRGLAAAHAADLVHRDFKPDNVIVGDDGRVRVMDFGLARLRPGDERLQPAQRDSDLRIEARSPLSESLTFAGSVVGTPAYMAPEIFGGRGADARTDQFAFGVTLYEALFKTRPFKKDDLRAQKAPPPKVPGDTKVPARIHKAVLRAIAEDPAQRWPGMDALLGELVVDPHRTRNRALIVGGIGVTTAGAFTLALALRADAPQPCQGIDARLAGAWDTSVKQKVQAAFAATGVPHAGKAFTQLERALDRYTGEWTKVAVESCRATRVRRDQTEEVFGLRQFCLEQRLEDVRALTTLLVEADASNVDTADKVGEQLEPLAHCSNLALLRSPGAPSPELRDKLMPLMKHLATARAATIAGRYLTVLVETQKAYEAAAALRYAPMQADAMMFRGLALVSTGNGQEAAEAFREAVLTGIAGYRDDITSMAAYMSATVLVETLNQPGEAKLMLELGDRFSKRLGIERLVELKRNTVAGVMAAKAGNTAAAVEALERALAAALRDAGGNPDEPTLWGHYTMLGTAYVQARLYAKAIPQFERALALREAIVGPDHADLALVLSGMGVAYGNLGQRDKGRAAFERALSIREKQWGKRNPMLVGTLNNFADYSRLQQDWEGGLVMAERAVSLAEKVPGRDHPLFHVAATTKAELLGGGGKLAEARALFDEVLASERRTGSPALSVTLNARCELEQRDKKYSDAATFAQQAIDAFVKAGGPDNPEMFSALVCLGRARHGLGDQAATRTALERALALGQKAGMTVELEPAKQLLASLPKT